MKKTIISIVAATTAFTFSNCTTGTLSNPYAPGASNIQKDTTTGAILGTVAGGIIGHQSGRGIEGALLGGGVGAIAGSAVGQSKDASGN